MQRPQLLRSENSLMQNLSMFKTQPFQNFNVLYDAIGNLQAKQKAHINSGTEDTKNALKDAKQKAAWAVVSQFVQLLVFAGMTFAWNMFRGKKGNYANDEEEVSFPSATKGIGKDMLGGAVSVVPFGSDVWELLSSKLFGDSYYGMDAVTVQALTDAVTSVSGLTDLLTDTVKSMATGGEIDWKDAAYKTDNYIDDISKALGVPYENVVNLFNAIFLQSAKAVKGKYLGTYAAMKLTTNPTTYSKDYYDLLYKAYCNDKAAYNELYADMVEEFGADKISSAMEARMKNAQGVKSVGDLEQRYLSPSQQPSYDRTMKSVQSSTVWKKATGEQRKHLEEDLYDLVTGNKTGQKLQEKIDDGAEYGVTETDLLLYNLALEVVDKPNKSGKLGTYTNAEMAQALKMLGISGEKAAYLRK